MSKRKLHGSLALLTILLSTQGALCMTGGADKERDGDAASTGSSSSTLVAAPAPDTALAEEAEKSSALVPLSGGGGEAVARSLTSSDGSEFFGSLTFVPSSGVKVTSVSEALQTGLRAAFPFAYHYSIAGPKRTTVLFSVPVPGEETKIALGVTFTEEQPSPQKLEAVGFPFTSPPNTRVVLTPLNPSYQEMFKIEESVNMSQRIVLTRPQAAGFLPEKNVRAAWGAFNAVVPGSTKRIKTHVLQVAQDYIEALNDF